MAKSLLLILSLSLVCPTAPIRAQTNSAASTDVSLLEKAFELEVAAQTDQDRAKAVATYATAAAAGDAYAHLRLGYLYETGDGVPQDYGLARQHYQAAVDAGLHGARVRLAICHLEGWGGPVDRPKFAQEIRRGAEAGDGLACRILAALYWTGIAVPKDQAESMRWLERAAQQGDAEAQLDLGVNLEAVQRRLVAKTNVELARTWYQQAAEQEYFSAMRAMARSLLSGEDRATQWPEARRWLELATEGGDPEAPFVQAICELLLPQAGPDGIDPARALLRTASTRGNPRATEVLQLELAGRTLREAARYVLETPFEERYMQNLANSAGEGDDVRPVPFRVVKPIYPQALSLSGVVGKATLEFIVDTKGRVRDIKVISTSHPLFAERGVEALHQWRFHPGKVKGRLVNVRIQLPLEFDLPKEELSGVDAFFSHAMGLAAGLGGQAELDTRDLRMAKALRPLTLPPEVVPLLPTDAACLMVLVLDKTGRPIRGHVLDSTPEIIGPLLLKAALTYTFEPRLSDGQPEASSVLLPFLTGKYAPPASPQNN
jgi:TonB family protein